MFDVSLAKKAISDGGKVAVRAEKGLIREQGRREAGGGQLGHGTCGRQHDGAARPGAMVQWAKSVGRLNSTAVLYRSAVPQSRDGQLWRKRHSWEGR